MEKLKSDTPLDYFDWNPNEEENKYCRMYINFQYNLLDIFNYYNNNKRHNNDDDNDKIPIDKLCENLLNFKDLYINDKSLIDHNIIYIDFKNYYVLKLDILEETVCEFKNISFYPNFKHKGKIVTSRDITTPFSNFILKTNCYKMDFGSFNASRIWL